jgi:hypothetical protein
MSLKTNEQLVTMSRAEWKALMPGLSPEQLRFLATHVKSQGKCGSLQTADGLPCMKTPRFGWTVCNKHGERAPQTAAKAERLLAIARMPAIEWILEEIDRAQEDTCEKCGYPDHSLKERKHTASLAYRLLDRTGFGPHSKVDFTVNRSDVPEIPLENWSEEERGELRALLTQVRALKDKVAFRLASDAGRQARDVVEGQVVRTELLTPALPDTSGGER